MADIDQPENGAPSGRGSAHAVASPRPEDSVFSQDGDDMLAGVKTRADETIVNLPNQCPPLPAPTTNAQNISTPLEHSFRKIAEFQKNITNVLFDPTCKITNSHRAQIVTLLGDILQECAEMRAIAAQETGKNEELRHIVSQFTTQAHPKSSVQSNPRLTTYAAATAANQLQTPLLDHDMPNIVQQSNDPNFTYRQEHAHIMFLTPLVPTSSPADALFKALKTNIDPVKENIKISDLVIRKTTYGLTIFTNRNDTLTRLREAISNNTITSTLMQIRIPQRRRPRIKITGVDPDVTSTDILQAINTRNDDITLDTNNATICVSYKERSGNFSHILEVSPQIYRTLMNKTKVTIGWTKCPVTEDFHVPVCTFCATYGHPRRACPVKHLPERAVCTRCGGPHLGSDCTVRAGDAAVCCTECRRQGRAVLGHPTGDRRCPVLNDRIARLKARTDYG